MISAKLSEQEMESVVRRLIQIYAACIAIPKKPTAKLEPVDIADWIGKAVPTRLDSVTDRRTGLEYAAWCIGETLAACGGMDLMRLVYGMFEDQTSLRASSWLDHRWNGVGIPGGGIWTS